LKIDPNYTLDQINKKLVIECLSKQWSLPRKAFKAETFVIYFLISFHNLSCDSEPEKSTGPSGVIPIAVRKQESNVEILPINSI
jgi:hypothetical protein